MVVFVMVVGCRCLSDMFDREQFTASAGGSSSFQEMIIVFKRPRISSAWRDVTVNYVKWRHFQKKAMITTQNEKIKILQILYSVVYLMWQGFRDK